MMDCLGNALNLGGEPASAFLPNAFAMLTQKLNDNNSAQEGKKMMHLFAKIVSPMLAPGQ